VVLLGGVAVVRGADARGGGEDGGRDGRAGGESGRGQPAGGGRAGHEESFQGRGEGGASGGTWRASACGSEAAAEREHAGGVVLPDHRAQAGQDVGVVDLGWCGAAEVRQDAAGGPGVDGLDDVGGVVDDAGCPAMPMVSRL
jgi:hypothetical protein